MATQKIYRLTWMRADNTPCTLTITDVSESTWDSTETIDLTPGSTPFVTKEDSDTNPLIPIRTQTGTVTFVYTGNFDIELKSSHQWRVKLTETNGTDSTIAFLGWLKAETYDQSLWEMNDEISINVIDDLEAMKTWDLDQSLGFEIATLRSMMSECLAHINDNGQTISFSDDVCVTAGGNMYYVLGLRVSRYNFFQVNDTSDSDDTEQQEYSADTCYDLLEKICKTFGWTLRCIGTKWIFSYPGTKEYKQAQTLTEFINGTRVQGDVTPAELTEDDIEVVGQHTFSVEQGYRKVAVVSQLNKIGDAVPDIDLDDATVQWVTSGVSEDVQYYSGEVASAYKKVSKQKVKYLKPKNKNVVLHHLYSDVNTDSSGYVQESSIKELATDVQENNTINGTDYYYDHIGGAHAVSLDYWDTPGDEGSGTSTGKINYSFKNRIVLVSAMPCLNQYGYRMQDMTASNTPALHMEGAASALYDAGAFEIKAKMHTPGCGGYLYGYYTQDHGYGPCMGGNNIDTERPTLLCRLSVGNYYWNGSDWTTTASTFLITFNRQDNYSETDIQTNKTLAMQFTATDYVAKISSTMSGKVVFDIFRADSDTTATNRRVREVCFLSDLEVKYCEPVDYSNNSNSNEYSHTYSRTNEGWTEDMSEVDLDIYSDNNDGASYGVLSTETATISQLYDKLHDGVLRRPELSLLDKYQEHFSRSRKYLKLKLDNTADLFGVNYITIQGTKYAILARTDMDWYSNEAEFLLESLS